MQYLTPVYVAFVSLLFQVVALYARSKTKLVMHLSVVIFFKFGTVWSNLFWEKGCSRLLANAL